MSCWRPDLLARSMYVYSNFDILAHFPRHFIIFPRHFIILGQFYMSPREPCDMLYDLLELIGC